MRASDVRAYLLWLMMKPIKRAQPKPNVAIEPISNKMERKAKRKTMTNGFHKIIRPDDVARSRIAPH